MKKLLVILTMLVFIAAGSTTYAIDPPPTDYDVAFVNGYIYDDTTSEGISGAQITAVCLNNGNSNTGISAPNGYYLILLQCADDETVEVTATYDGETGSNTGTVTYIGSMMMGATRVDIGIVTINVSVPEFPIAAIPALLSIVSFGLIRKRLI